MATTTVFKNPDYQTQIELNGYAIVPFASSQMINDLKEFYHSLNNLPLKGTHVTMFNPSSEYRKKVDAKIKEICAGQIDEIINGYRILYTNFMVKEPGEEGDFPLHQDWTYVKEPESTSYAFWIPLGDVDLYNGALQVVKRSHLFTRALRGPYIHEPFTHISNTVKEKYSTIIPLKAGEALVWDHRLLHFSKPNTTNIPRLAFTLIMVPQNTPVIHCFGVPDSPEGEIEVYQVDTDFFMHYEISKRPQNVPMVEKVIQNKTDWDEHMIEKMYKK